MGSTRKKWRSVAVKTTAAILLALMLVQMGAILYDAPLIFPTVKSDTTNWGDGNYHYRQALNLSTSTGTGTGYQVLIKLNWGNGTSSGSTIYLNEHAQTDFDDIKFISWDNSTVYDYWRQNYTASSNAYFWVEISEDLTSTSRNFWVYYGKASASTLSNGLNTFPVLFDDFEDGSLNTTTWYNSSAVAFNESSGYWNSNSNDWGAGLVSQNTIDVTSYYIMAGVIVGNASNYNDNILAFCINKVIATGDYRCGLGGRDASGNIRMQNLKLGTHETFVDSGIAKSSVGLTILQLRKSSSTNYASVNWSSEVSSSTDSTSTANNYLQILGANGNKWDWVLARKYASSPPTYSSWSAEDTFSDTTAPTFGSGSASTNYAGYPCVFSIPAYDDIGPSHITVETNNTGVLVNETWITVPANATTMNFTITLNSTAGMVVGYTFYLNDTSGNVGKSSTYTLTTQADAAAPTFGSPTNSTPYTPGAVTLTVPVYDDVKPKNCTVQTNATGSSVNATWQTVSANGTSMSFSVTMPNTVGTVVAFKFFAMDYAGNVGESSTSYITTQWNVGNASWVATTNSTNGYEVSIQRTGFSANGLNWEFFVNTTDLCYTTSSNGVTWSTPKVLSTDDVNGLAVAFDGAYGHMIFSVDTAGLYYAKLNAFSNGTASFVASPTLINSGSVTDYAICIDSNGYPWVSMRANNATFTCWATTSTTKDGTWTTKSGFPHQLVTGGDNKALPIVPMADGKIVVFGGINSGTVTAWQYNGSAWLGGTATSTALQFYWKLDAISDNTTDIAHLVLMSTGNDFVDCVYNATLNDFTSETAIYNDTALTHPNPITESHSTKEGDPNVALSINRDTGDIYGFFLGMDNCTYYLFFNGTTQTWNSTPVLMHNITALGLGMFLSFINAAFGDYSLVQPLADYYAGNYIALLYVTADGVGYKAIQSTDNPYNVTISTLYVGASDGAGDTTAPTFGSGSGNATLVDTPCNLSIPVYDDEAPSYITVEHNNSGVAVNETWISVPSNGTTMNFTITLNSTAGVTVVYRFFANDTTGNVATSSSYSLTTTGGTNTLSVPPFTLTSAGSLSGGSWDSATLTLTFTCGGTAVNITNTGGYGYPATLGFYGDSGTSTMEAGTLILAGLTPGQQSLCWMWGSGMRFNINSTGTVNGVTYADTTGVLTINGSGNFTITSGNGFPSGDFFVTVNGSTWDDWDWDGTTIWVYNVPEGSVVVIDFNIPGEGGDNGGIITPPPPTDTDHDGTPDSQDTDDDGDGIPDIIDPHPLVPDTQQPAQNETEPTFINPEVQEQFNEFANNTFTFVPESARPAVAGVTIIGMPLLLVWLLIFLLGAASKKSKRNGRSA